MYDTNATILIFNVLFCRPVVGALERDKTMAEKLWEKLNDLNTCLCNPIIQDDPRHPPSPTDRARAAERYQLTADEFVSAYHTVKAKADRCVYVHVVKCEVAKFIRLYGNLSHYSSQGAEHLHVHTKFAMRWLTNKRAGDRVKQAFEWVLLWQHVAQKYPIKGLRKRKRE